jgi:hypothetical protein
MGLGPTADDRHEADLSNLLDSQCALLIINLHRPIFEHIATINIESGYKHYASNKHHD